MLNSEFFETVSYNCDVSDANYWGYFSICSLLLRLRQLFKIERDLEPWESIENEEIFKWIEKKEEVWKSLENTKLKQVQINKSFFSPFDVEEINSFIFNKGLVYGAGYSLFKKPSFFIGLISKIEEIDGYRIYFIGKEIVRDLFSSSGMSQNNTIYIRLMDIKYRIWENLHGWQNKKDIVSEILLSRFGNPSGWQYPYPEFEKIVQKYSQIVLYHEIAEQQESLSLWMELIKNCMDSKTEYILRGIKDFVADFSIKGPVYKAIDNKDEELLALYLVSQNPYHKKVLKQTLAQIKDALHFKDWKEIDKIRCREFKRWKSVSKQLIEIFELKGFNEVKSLTDKIFEGYMN
uniref:Uncharacterized protein n=1 Tax=Thermodesulfovibrio aggregans TaxID=86166 RepID=A0A7C4EJM7_9BACT